LNAVLENDLLVVGLHAPDPSSRVAGSRCEEILSRVPRADEHLGVVSLQNASLINKTKKFRLRLRLTISSETTKLKIILI
jgi:hypothetical protein